MIVWANIIFTYLYYVDASGVQEILEGVFISDFTDLKILQLFRLFLKVNDQLIKAFLVIFVIWLVIAIFLHFIFNKRQWASKVEIYLYGDTMQRILAYWFVGFMMVGNLILLFSYLYMFVFGKEELFNELFIFEWKPVFLTWIPFLSGTILCFQQILFELENPVQK